MGAVCERDEKNNPLDEHKPKRKKKASFKPMAAIPRFNDELNSSFSSLSKIEVV